MTHPYRTPTPVTTPPEYRHGKWMRLRRAYQRLRVKGSRPLARLRCWSCNVSFEGPRRTWSTGTPVGSCVDTWGCKERSRERRLAKRREAYEHASASGG